MISWNVGNCSENSLGRLKCCKHWEQLYGQLLDSFWGLYENFTKVKKVVINSLSLFSVCPKIDAQCGSQY
jgi:hypothetical protein